KAVRPNPGAVRPPVPGLCLGLRLGRSGNRVRKPSPGVRGVQRGAFSRSTWRRTAGCGDSRAWPNAVRTSFRVGNALVRALRWSRLGLNTRNRGPGRRLSGKDRIKQRGVRATTLVEVPTVRRLLHPLLLLLVLAPARAADKTRPNTLT